MEEIFCPFTKGTCNYNCMYRGGNLDLPDDCELYDAIQVIRSYQAPGNPMDKSLESINSNLASIESNTSFDPTSSSSILSEVEEIKSILKKK